MSEALLSVVIPTRNRQIYVVKAIEHILSMGEGSIQVVIQDNSTDNSLEGMLRVFESPQIKYTYIEERLSFVDNFSAAIENTDGEYVCIIGDDDSVLPDIVTATRFAKANRIDVLVPNVGFEYFWPDSIPINGKTDGVVRCLTGKLGSEMIETNYAVEKLMRQGGQDYLFLNTAKLYHGIVRRACLDEVKRKVGNYFGGLSPDIFMAVALSVLNLKVMHISSALTIAGVCPTSGSAQSTKGEHVGAYEDAPHLQGHNHYEWSELVPKFYSVETIWADSALAALVSMDRRELMKKFSVSEICGACYAKHPKYRKLILDHWQKYREPLPKMQKAYGDYQIASYGVRSFARRVYRRLSRMNKSLAIVSGVEDIAAAANVYRQRVRKGYLFYDEQKNELIWRNL